MAVAIAVFLAVASAATLEVASASAAFCASDALPSAYDFVAIVESTATVIVFAESL